MGKSIHAINGDFTGKHIVSIDQFSAGDINLLFSKIPQMQHIVEEKKTSQILSGNIVTLFFYEPSSRTFGSFSSAVKRLGGQTISYQDAPRVSSSAKGETLADTIRVVENYCDAIILRTPEEGAAKKAAEAAFFVPVINAGDGKGEHPSQALLDFYTIYQKHKRLDNLTMLFAGDMLNGRTIHSLLRGFALYPGITIYLLSPEELKLSREDFTEFTKRGLQLVEISSEKDIPKNAQVWYWTRVQKERFSDQNAYENVKNKFVLSQTLLDEFAGKDTIVMHPLPRVGEIAEEVDTDPRAYYFKQVQNGVYVRMALLGLVLGKLQ